MPMVEFDFATWRLALPRALARHAVIEPEMLAKLEGAWELARIALLPTAGVADQGVGAGCENVALSQHLGRARSALHEQLREEGSGLSSLVTLSGQLERLNTCAARCRTSN